MNKFEERVQRTKWMMDARFGMFIHWGLYSIPARGEWVRSREEISVDDYQQFFEELLHNHHKNSQQLPIVGQ